jgi:putative redox protein
MAPEPRLAPDRALLRSCRMASSEPVRTAVASWAGGRRFEGETGRDGRFEVESEDGLPGARPTELLLGALASCEGLDVISILEKKRQSVGRYTVTATGEIAPGHPQIFASIAVEHEVEGPDLSEEAVRRSIELSATRYCPVTAMLSAGETQITHRFRLGGDARPSQIVVVTGPHAAGLAPDR